MILPRQFLRLCRQTMFRPQVADSSGIELTGAGLLTRTLVFRRLLRRLVLEAGEAHVGLLLPPTVAAVVANAALALDRRIAVNLNYTASSEILNESIRQCGIRHVLTSRRVLERFPLELDAKLVFLEDFKDQVRPADKLLSAAAAWLLPPAILERWLGLTSVQPEDVMTVIFTSGSTGRPKGVMLTHANIASNITAFQTVLDFRPTDVILGILPLFHSFGYTTTLWTALSLDLKVVYHVSPLEPRPIGELSKKHGVTVIVAAPTFLRNYVRRCTPDEFARLEVVITGSEKLPPKLADEFEARFGVRPVEGYGLTETAPVVSCNIPPGRERTAAHCGCRQGSVGQPLPEVEAKVVDLETEADLGPDQAGMLWVRGPNVMKGYLGRPDSTAQAMRGDWYVTGDIATIDAEGFISITGRLSRFSKIGGEMVPHLGVEEALAKVLDFEESDELRRVVTSVPDEKKGERLVVLHTGLPVSPEEVCRRLIDANFSPLWIPSANRFYRVEAIPVLGTGKVDLKRTQELAQELTLEQAAG